MRPDARAAGRVGLAGAASLLLLAGASAAAAGVRTVRPGAVLHVTAPGFAPSAPVDVRTAGQAAGVAARADRGGVVHLAYRVPTRPGTYTLLLAGAVGRPGAAAATGNMTVTVPLVLRVPYRVSGPGSGVEGVGQHAPGHPGQGVGGQSAGPADTGADVAGLLGLGAGLLAVGTALLGAVRRRRRVP